jgi:hypothetical protein
MKSGTESKLKFKQLQRRFDLALWQAHGLLDTLWEFTKSNAPAGDIDDSPTKKSPLVWIGVTIPTDWPTRWSSCAGSIATRAVG